MKRLWWSARGSHSTSGSARSTTSWCSASTYVALFEAAAEFSNDPLAGLSLSATAGPETLGALGFLFLSSDTLGQGLANLCRYVSAVQDATDNAVEVEGELATMTYQITVL